MKLSSLKIWNRIIISVFLCCALVLLQISVASLVNAQLNCPPSSTPLPASSNIYHWAPNASVQVNINSSPGHFNLTEYNNCIKPVFNNFNTANEVSGNSSRVTFQLTFSPNSVAEFLEPSLSMNPELLGDFK